jgi:hypothetical protein
VTSDPKRLTVVGATDLERTLLQAARHERPSPELTARMAAGLGISAAAVVTAAAPAAAAATAPMAAAAPAAVTKTSALAVWISGGAIAVAVAAGVVAVRVASPPAGPTPASKPASAFVAAPAASAPVAEPAPDIITQKRIEKIRKRPAPPPAGDLRDQIALVDAARTAVKSGATERAFALLHRYEITYPSGAFRPEVLALRIEALDDAGRSAEARSLAREFLARYPQSPVADRVARVAGTK